MKTNPKPRAFDLFVLVGTLTVALSSSAQTMTTDARDHFRSDTIGKVVLELDEQIWAIHQDRNYSYWFGTNGSGVYRFDGKKLTQFTKTDGLSGDQVRDIQEDKSGNVYFDTPDGISKFDGDKIITLDAVSSVEQDWKSETDDLWFKGSGNINGAYRYDGVELQHLKFPEYDLEEAFGVKQDHTRFSPYGVYSIFKDSRGAVWFGTLSAGVYRYAEDSAFWISEKELTVLDDGRVPGVRSIIEDKDGNFWLSNILARYKITQDDSSVREKEAVEFEKLAGIKQPAGQGKIGFPYFMGAVTDDKNSDLWMLTYSQGVWKYDGAALTRYLVKDGDKELLLHSIYKDRQGVLWVGTGNAGVFRFDGNVFVRFVP